jgi:methionyl aminopeptidase
MALESMVKSTAEIIRVRRAAEVVARVITAVARRIEDGVRPIDLNYLCEALIRRAGGTPCMRGFNGFPSATAFSVNDVAAHGVPGDRPLRAGDLITFDVAVDVDGWKADGAWTLLVPGSPPEETVEKRRILNAAWQCALAGVATARPPHRIGDIGSRVCRHAERDGYQILTRFTGHGVGREMHEPPVFRYAKDAGRGQPLVPGLVFTVEPVVGTTQRIIETADGFGFRTADASPTAQFEHTIAVFADSTEILTMPHIDLASHAASPPNLTQV